MKRIVPIQTIRGLRYPAFRIRDHPSNPWSNFQGAWFGSALVGNREVEGSVMRGGMSLRPSETSEPGKLLGDKKDIRGVQVIKIPGLPFQDVFQVQF